MANPKFAAGFRIGIVNPLNLVGNEVKAILKERSLPFGKLVLLDSTGKDAGSLTETDDEPAVIAGISDDELEDLDLVFFCGSSEANAEWLAKAEEDNFIAFDLSQPSTLQDGRLAIAGVNLEELGANDRLLISPHPVAIPIALLLHQIGLAAPVESCTATVVQPASQFDQAGVEELAQQTISVLNIQNVPKDVFKRQLSFNLYPAPEQLESYIVSQIRALTDARTDVALLITQGAVFHSYTYSLFIRTRSAIDLGALRQTLAGNAAIVFAEGDQQFGTVDAAGKDEVLVAELRTDPTVERGFWLWAVCDNLRRGSALNAVLVAEKLLFGTDPAN